MRRDGGTKSRARLVERRDRRHLVKRHQTREPGRIGRQDCRQALRLIQLRSGHPHLLAAILTNVAREVTPQALGIGVPTRS